MNDWIPAVCVCHGGGANVIDAVLGFQGTTSNFHLVIKKKSLL